MLLRPLSSSLDSVCTSCLRRISQTKGISSQRRQYVSASSRTASAALLRFQSGEFFGWNERLREHKINTKELSRLDSTKRGASTAAQTGDVERTSLSRKRRLMAASRSGETTESDSSESLQEDSAIPPDASSRLTTISNTLPQQSFRRKFAAYLSLSKPRLTFLIVLTTTAAYSIYPVPAMLDPSATSAPSLSTITLLFLTSGTFLTCASANAFNMLLEPEHDAKMSRTRNRPLVRGLLSGRAAFLFAIATGIVGTAGLYFGVNPTTAGLAAANIVIYAGMYTPLKRIHPINTWVGGIVGAIPPLMGWTAAAGQCASETNDWRELLLGPDSRGGWALAALLGLWQIPHFAALSWTIRHEYSAAGYKMLCSSNPRLDAMLSLGCAALLPACCTQLWLANVIDSWALAATWPANAWIMLRSWQFLRLEGQKGSARNLFWASIWYLPIVLVTCMVGKTGLSDRVVNYWTGNVDDEGYYEDDEDEE